MILLLFILWSYLGFFLSYPLCKIIETGDIKKSSFKDVVINLFSALPTIALIYLIILVNFIAKPLDASKLEIFLWKLNPFFTLLLSLSYIFKKKKFFKEIFHIFIASPIRFFLFVGKIFSIFIEAVANFLGKFSRLFLIIFIIGLIILALFAVVKLVKFIWYF
jgi:hypothetical protein